MVSNTADLTKMLTAASIAVVGARRTGMVPMIANAARPAITEAATYLHTATTMGWTPKWIGLHAYQNAGIVRIQKDAVQAIAIPTGPQARASTNSVPVTANSTIPHRSQRSPRPRDR